MKKLMNDNKENHGLERVLVCAYSCLKDPDERFGNGGEGVLGWNLAKQISRFNDVYVLTHFKNKNIIESQLQANRLNNLKFYYIELPIGLELLNKFHGGVQLAAYLWQIKAYFVAKKLHKKFNFNMFHHITYANDWMASYIGALLPMPYIRGPGGGAHRVPKYFVKNYPIKNRFLEKLRNFGQWIFRHDPFFILGHSRAKAILVCNLEAKDAMPKKWRSKVYFFPVNGISKEDLAKFSTSDSHGGDFLVITAGKFLKIKSFDLAIAAFKIFNEKIGNSKMILVGDGPEFNNLKNLAGDLNQKGAVVFEKWLPREKLLKKISECHVFFFPSLRDGGGQVVVEAMAQGKPVVCFDIAGPGFHISENWGIKIKPENPDQAIKDMAKALEKLYYGRDLREKMGQEAKKRAEYFYLWDTLGDKLHNLYENILSNS